MYPGQFYTRQFIDKWYKGRSNIASKKYKFYNGEGEKGLQMGFINALEAPSEATIRRVQLEEIKKNFPITDQILADELNKIGSDLGNKNVNAEYTLEEALSLIESVFSATLSSSYIKNTEILEILSTHISQNKHPLASYEMALWELKRLVNFLQERNIYNKKDIQTYINRLDKTIARLEEDVKMAQQGSYGKSNYGYWYTNNGIVSNGKYGAIIGSGRKLKGFYFESELLRILREHLTGPLGEDYIVIDTSKVNGPVFDILGGVKETGKQLRTDFMIFKNIKVKYFHKGKQMTGFLSDFINACNESIGEGNITIDNDELQRILGSDNFITGIQAKSGINQRPFNNFPVPVSTGFALAAGQWYSFFLAMKKWYTYNHIYANAAEFDTIFNLGISKQILYVIGQGNSFMALRNRIVPTVKYFEEMIHDNCYIKGLEMVSLGKSNQSIPVNLSSTTFSYKQGTYSRFHS